MSLSLSGAKVPGSEVTGYESSKERKFWGAKVPSMVLSLLGAKVRGNESSIIRLYTVLISHVEI